MISGAFGQARALQGASFGGLHKKGSVRQFLPFRIDPVKVITESLLTLFLLHRVLDCDHGHDFVPSVAGARQPFGPPPEVNMD
jgi:hypothetical protein